MTPEVLQRARAIKLVIFDVDGVLTDGRLYYSPNGEELKVFYVQDGVGIKLLQQTGVVVAVITGRQSDIVSQRLRSLGVTHIYQGQEDKRGAFAELLTKLNLQPVQVAYVGDDLPDLPVLASVGLGIAVANAHPVIAQNALWQTRATGGLGAAREVCDLIMDAQETMAEIYKTYLPSK